MKISHRFFLEVDSRLQAFLKVYGIGVKEGLSSVIVPEMHKHFNEIRDEIQKHHPVTTYTTSFEKRDLESAKYLAIYPKKHIGYPQPEDPCQVMRQVYGSDYCCVCGGKNKQLFPYRIKMSTLRDNPKIFQLNWTFDTFFSATRVFEEVFRPFGIECYPIVNHENGANISSHVQLVIPTVNSNFQYSCDDLDQCETCKRYRRRPHTRGFLPLLSHNSTFDMFKPQTVFGSGSSSNQMVVVSQRLRQSIIACGVNSLSYYPLAT